MGLNPNNALTLAGGKQVAKGTAQATPQFKLAFTGGYGPDPIWDPLQPAETDAQRQEADAVRVGFSVKGQSEHYLRPAQHHYLAHAVLGSTATTGTTPKTHVATPTDDGSAPYYTLFRAVAQTAEVTEMVDCQASQVQWTGGQGQALSAQIDWVGLAAILGASDPAGDVLEDPILVYPQVAVTYGGVQDGSVQSFQVTVNQNRSAWIGDTGTAALDIVPGQLIVTAQLVMLFQNDEEYRNFLGGAVDATTPAVAIPSKSISILASESADSSIQWDMADAQITDYTRAFGTDGAPLLATISLKSKKSATLSDVISVTTVNAIAAP
jgi:hypothetical protein